MHKSLLKFAFARAFGLLEVALDALKYAYGMVDKSGEFVLGEIDGAVKELHRLADKAVDELP